MLFNSCLGWNKANSLYLAQNYPSTRLTTPSDLTLGQSVHTSLNVCGWCHRVVKYKLYYLNDTSCRNVWERVSVFFKQLCQKGMVTYEGGEKGQSNLLHPQISRLKKCLCSRGWSLCFGGQESKHQPQACSISYQSQQTSSCQLCPFSDCSPSRCGLWSQWRFKRGWQKYERCLCNLVVPCVDTSGDSRAQWMTL